MHYVDHAATTPMLAEAVEAVTSHLQAHLSGDDGFAVGNPSSLHGAGRRARRIVEESRETLAKALGARPSEIIFTGGGTESDNLAVKGLFWSRRAADPTKTRILASGVEHHAVLDPVVWLVEHEGAQVTWVEVDQFGRVNPEQLEAALAADGGPSNVALASIMWANNEVGTIQPIGALREILASHAIPMHSDAVQAFGAIPVDAEAVALDAMTVTAHKIGGPGGIGALVLRRGVECVPVQHGGGQERDVRSGTLDVASIAGFAAAAEVAVRELEVVASRNAALRDSLIEGVLRLVPNARLQGDPDPAGRLPGNAHISFPGCEGDALLLLLDAAGVACSTGSACSAGVPRPSHVLLAMGVDESIAQSSLRFSLGHTSTQADVDAVLEAIGPAVERAMVAGSVSARGGQR